MFSPNSGNLNMISMTISLVLIDLSVSTGSAC